MINFSNMQTAKKTTFRQIFADFPTIKATFTQKLLYDDN